MLIYLRFFTILFLLALSLQGFGQNSYIGEFKSFGIENGLPSNSVYSICEDQYGFIWIGTSDGLCRFDGYHIKTFRDFSSDKKSLRKNFVRRLFTARNGDLWIGMERGLVRFNPKNHQFFYEFIWSKSLGKNVIDQTYLPYFELKNGKIIATNSSSQHVLIDPATNQIDLLFDASSPLYISYPVAFDETRIAIQKNGIIFIYHPQTGKYEEVLQTLFNKPMVPWEGCFKENILFLSSGDRITKIDLEKKQLIDEVKFFEDNDPINRISSVNLSPRKDFLIIGTKGKGMRFLNLELDLIAGFETENKNSTSISSNIIQCVFLDSQNHLWIGTDLGGFSCLPYTNRFNSQFQGKFISSIFRSNETTYISLYNEGLYQINDSDNTLKPISLRSNPKNVRSIIEFDGKLLIGCEQGLIEYDPATHNQSLVWVTPNNQGTVRDIFKKDRNTVVVCTNWGLYRLQRVNHKWQSSDCLLSINAGRIIKGFNNELIVCSKDPIEDKSAVRINPYLIKQNGYYVFDRTSQAVKLKNSMWIAGSYGLVKLNPHMQVLSVFDFTNSPLQTLVMSMEGYNNQVWLGTNNRLFMLDVPSSAFYGFDSDDGLPSREFVSNASFRDEKAGLYFGTISGLISFNPDSLKLNKEVKQPRIISIKVFDEDWSDTTGKFNDSLILNHDQNTLYVEFSSPNPAMQNRVQYSYQLGDDKWINIGNDHGIWLNHLSPGQYALNIKATSSDGIWSQGWTVLFIQIKAPFWQTWWFVSLVWALVIGSASLVVYKLSVFRQKRRIALLEKKEALNRERIRISKDLHDELGSGLSKIKFLSDLALHDTDKITQFNRLKSISETSGHVSDSMKELVWLMQAENTTLDVLLASIREYTYDYLEAFSIEPEINIPEPIPTLFLTKDAYRNLFMIVRESLQNIIKHSQANTVNLQVKITSELQLTIQDNGKGFIPDSKTGHGLGNMKSRTDQMGGKFELNTGNQGTQIKIMISLLRIQNV